MTPQAKLEDLKNCAKKLSLEIIYRDLSDVEFTFRSGFCKINGSQVVFLDNNLPIENEINIILQGFKRLKLDSFYISPWIRDRLEKIDF